MKYLFLVAFFVATSVAAQKDYCVKKKWMDVFYGKHHEKNEIDTSCVPERYKTVIDSKNNCEVLPLKSNDYTCLFEKDTCEKKYLFTKENVEEKPTYEATKESETKEKVEEKTSNENSNNMLLAVGCIFFLLAYSSGENNKPRNRRNRYRRR